MLVRFAPLLPALALSLLGCGSAAPPTDTPATVASTETQSQASEPQPVKSAEPSEDPKAREIPTQCASNEGRVCLPPAAFVKYLCDGSFPDAALVLFSKGTPFTRGYLSRETEAWNASGGTSSSSKLAFEEEVLILAHRVPDTGGMVVSGSGGSYDVLRWDGSCASLMADEVRFRANGKPKHAVIPWKRLEEKTRQALESNEKISQLVEERRKECKGATMGKGGAKCEKADMKMSGAIVDYLRGGGTVPSPGALP